MADSVGADPNDFEVLARSLGDVPENAGQNIRSAFEVTSIKVKRSWQEPLQGSPLLPRLPYAISYDIEVAEINGGSVIRSEIGFDKAKPQGALGNISEYGTPTITGRGYGAKALSDNEADFEHGLELAIEQALRESGL